MMQNLVTRVDTESCDKSGGSVGVPGISKAIEEHSRDSVLHRYV